MLLEIRKIGNSFTGFIGSIIILEVFETADQSVQLMHSESERVYNMGIKLYVKLYIQKQKSQGIIWDKTCSYFILFYLDINRVYSAFILLWGIREMALSQFFTVA